MFIVIFKHSNYNIMRLHLIFLLGLICSGLLKGQVEFYDGSSQVLGDERLFSTICIGFNDLNGDLKDDLFLLDEGKILKTFIQNAPKQEFDYEVHLQTSVNGDWAIISGDLTNDGVPEIICSGNEFGSQFLFLENGKYVKKYGTPQIFSQNSNLVDLNNDGFLDFFVCNDDGENLMFLNNGSGQMVETKMIDFQTSPEDDMSGNYSSIFTDIDGDDDLDLYIGKCRAGVEDPTDPRRINTLYINNGDGTYSENGEEAGLAIGAQSWSVDSGDIDNDGDLDLIVANHDGPHDLMLNDGQGKFERFELTPGGYTSFAFQSFFCDMDNNGWLDIVFTDPANAFILYNDEMSFTRREIVDETLKSFSTATGDLNSDGFPDLYLSFAFSFQQHSPFKPDRVLLNQTNSNNYIDFKLTGTISNRDAVGSKVILYQGEKSQTREIIVGKSYGIMNSTIVHFGLGQSDQVDSIKIKWPSGMESTFDDISQVNTLYSITEDGCISATLKMASLELCNGEPVDVTLPNDYDSYTWSTGEETQTISISESGWYKATLTKEGCVTQTSYFEVREELMLDQDEILAEIDQVICEGDVISLTAFPGSSFGWSTGEITQEINVTDSGLYNVTVHTNCNTYTSGNVEIKVKENIFPIVENDTVKIGEAATLVGDSDDLNWYLHKNDIVPVSTGSEFIIPELLYSQTYYAGNPNHGYGFERSLMSIVPLNNVGDSIYLNNEMVEFEVYEDILIKSVKVRTQKAGIRRFVLFKEGEEMDIFDVDLDVGVSTIDLDYELEPGNYALTTNTLVNITYLGTSHPQFSYSDVYSENDKRIIDFFEIKESQSNPGISPYFFDWNIEYGRFNCEPRVPVHAVAKMMVGVSETESNTMVYPNPASGYVYISTDMDLPFTVDIINMSGQIARKNIQSRSSEIQIELPSNAGIYYLRLNDGKKEFIKKLVIF